MYRTLLLLFSLVTLAAALEVANGQTALIPVPSDAQAVLTDKGKSIPLLRHPLDPSQKIALVPVGYRTPAGVMRLTLPTATGSVFIPLHVTKGAYRSETLTVDPSKVTPDAKQRERIGREYREAMKLYGATTPKRYWDSPFALPMQSTVTSPFGTARLFNGTLNSFHSGTDFRAKPGTPVTAVNDGVVVLAKERYYAGNSVIVDHGEGLYSCYYHLSRIDVEPGNKVAKNEILGLSGQSGRVTGPHLHFAVMLQSVQVDPLQLIETINTLFAVGDRP